MIKKKGKLIVICGIDGAGKSTQFDLLFQRLVNERRTCEKVIFTQADYGEKAKLVQDSLNCDYVFTRANINWQDIYPLIYDFVYKKELQKKELAYAVSMIFAGGCIQIYKECIEPLLDKGINVVLDRYYYDDIIYRGFWVEESFLENMYSSVKPGDINIYISVDSDALYKRNCQRLDGKSPLLADKMNYQILDDKFNEYILKLDNGYVIDGNRLENIINDDIYNLIFSTGS